MQTTSLCQADEENFLVGGWNLVEKVSALTQKSSNRRHFFDGWVTALICTLEDKVFVGTSSGKVYMFNYITFLGSSESPTLVEGGVAALFELRNGGVLSVGQLSGLAILRFTLPEARVVRPKGARCVGCVHFEEERRLLVAEEGGVMALFDFKGEKIEWERQFTERVLAVGGSENEEVFLVGSASAISVVSLESFEILNKLELSSGGIKLMYSDRNLETLAIYTSDLVLRIFSLETHKETHSESLESTCFFFGQREGVRTIFYTNASRRIMKRRLKETAGVPFEDLNTQIELVQNSIRLIEEEARQAKLSHAGEMRKIVEDFERASAPIVQATEARTAEYNELFRRNEEKKKQILESFGEYFYCIECCDRVREIMNKPCNHVTSCSDCVKANPRQTCQICKDPITGHEKIIIEMPYT